MHYQKIMPTRWTLLVAVVAVCLVGCVRTAPLVNPPPVGTNPNLEITRSAIHHAIGRTEWQVQKEIPGEILARLQRGPHVAIVDIHYDEKKLQLTYVSSENLKYAKVGTQEEIHKNYNVWVDQLMTEIQTALQAQQLFPAPPMPGQPIAAPPPPPPAETAPDGGAPITPAAPGAPPPDDGPRPVMPAP